MDHAAPTLSVVLCTHNGSATIGEQLRALGEQGTAVPWELVVVDNRSTDGTADLVRAAWNGPAPLRLVAAGDKAGLGYARNVGVASSSAPFVAFCDDDDVVGSGWVQAMADALSEHRLVASAFEYERLNDRDVLVGRARFQSSEVESFLGLPVCSGACGVRRTLWAELGGNDESLDATGEDFDFSLRALRLGAHPYFAAGAIYHYRLRTNSGDTFAQARANGRSHATLWARHGESRVGPAEDRNRAVRDWLWLITRAPRVALGRNRSLWLRTLGRRLGRIEGSIRERVVLP